MSVIDLLALGHPAATRPFLARALDVVAEWVDRVRGRTQLAALDDRALRDIGINRLDVARELDKPFWRP
jgi:uncharacterized protein YjiS (DUF1127 family)